jgi:hypothetical protein
LLVPAILNTAELGWIAELRGEVPSKIDDNPVPVGSAKEVLLERGYGTEVPDSDDDGGIPEEPVPK